MNTPGGTSGSVERGGRYNAYTGQRSYASGLSATGPGGSSVNREVGATTGPEGTGVGRETTVTNARTGETNTYGSARVGNDHYASADGSVYRNTGSGWEQQARSAGEDRLSSFSSSGSGWRDRFSGGGGDFADRSGGGGFADRFGGGGFGGRFGGLRR